MDYPNSKSAGLNGVQSGKSKEKQYWKSFGKGFSHLRPKVMRVAPTRPISDFITTKVTSRGLILHILLAGYLMSINYLIKKLCVASNMNEHFEIHNLYEKLTEGALAELDFLKLQDCISHFYWQRILPHDYRSKNLTIGRSLWQTINPGEPFDVDLLNPPQYIPEYKSQLQYDIRSAAQRQSKFYYNVSLPHYKDQEFLKAAVDRYKHHLHLKKTNPQLFAVPCYDFDLIWHVHQLYPLTYFNDMKALLGFILDHDDTETDRFPGSKLYDSEMQTREAWAQSGMSFSKRGAMYRGEPLPRLPPKPPGRFSCLATHDFEVQLVRMDAHLNPKKKFEVVIKSECLNAKAQRIVKGGEMSFGSQSAPLFTFTCNSTDESNFSVTLYHKRLLGRKKLQFTEFSLKDFLISLEQSNFSQFPVNNTTDTNFIEGAVGLHFRVTKPPIPKNFKFAAIPEPSFIKVNHVAHVLSQPTLMLMPKKIEMAMLPGEMTTNQIKDHRGQAAFNCKVVHSAECMLSAVEILDVYNNLEATAHVLDIGALPEADEVSNKDCITAAGKEGARAMLIRSRDDDYGVCVGKWVKREIKGRGGRKKDVSFMGVKYYSLNGQGWCKVKKLKKSKFLVVVRSGFESPQVQMKVDLDEGLITIPYAGVDDIPQCLAISFAIAILHLLCRPYSPKENQLAAPISRKTKVNHGVAGATAVTRIRRRSLSNSSLVLYATPSLMLATGYLCMTVPTNVYLSSCMGDVGWDFCPDIDISDGFDEMDCDGDWGHEIGFDDTGDVGLDNVSIGSPDADFEGDWGDGGCGGEGDGGCGDFGDGGACGGGGGCGGGGDGGGCGGGGGGDGGGCGGGDGGGGGCGGGGGEVAVAVAVEGAVVVEVVVVVVVVDIVSNKCEVWFRKI
ncbi:hypothetical protein QZH41_004054 [Actinostola sp. cb2023]|nr:hypothetical protein QZH41_004054 [Actinostola sp. cb2023]